jgi:hypothetical protein
MPTCQNDAQRAPIVTIPINARAQTGFNATAPATVGFEPYIIALPQPVSDTYYLVTQIEALIFCPNPPQDPPVGPGSSPASGLFLATASDVQNGETLAQAQVTINPRIRAIGLDTSINATFIPALGIYLVQFIWRSGAGPLVVPPNYQLVAILDPHPGTPQPGPGAGTIGQMSGLMSIEQQQ